MKPFVNLRVTILFRPKNRRKVRNKSRYVYLCKEIKRPEGTILALTDTQSARNRVLLIQFGFWRPIRLFLPVKAQQKIGIYLH